METRDQILETDGDHDGIHEYDNPLPTWFLYLFLGSILFSCLYSAYYFAHSQAVAKAAGVGVNLSSSGVRLKIEQVRAEAALAGQEAKELHGEELLSFLKSPGNVSQGESVYKTNCASCHGDQGQGTVGPNLVDRYWLHGGSPDALVESISHGYPDKGMPPWESVLGKRKVRLAAAYVLSIRGNPVDNPKPPQGEQDP